MSGIPVYLETFGCQMNELDSELVRGQLQRLGYAFVDRPEDAQIVLFNTCSVREHAESKAYSRIGLVGKRKAAGERVLLGVLGCMAERDGLDMLRRHPQVDVLCGPGELDRLPALLDAARRSEAASQAERVALAGNRSRRTATLHAVQDDLETLDLSRAFDPDAAGRARHSAQVRITRGCNKFCTYCVVPYTRGGEVHRPPDHIVEECKRLADAGAIEITLLGQTVNHYRYEHGHAVTADGREAPQVGPGLAAFRQPLPQGRQITTFARLLQRIHDEVPAIQRLRFVTSYPRDFGPDVLQVMADCPRICRYLHAPAQSGSDRILGLMNRGYTRAEYEAFVTQVFRYLPDATLAGDIIVGFPSETDADFEQTCTLVRDLPFKNNFIFKYSPRPGTTAIDRFPDDVPDAVKRLRNNQLLALQSRTSERVHAAWVGRTVEVLVEECVQATSTRQGAAGGVELRWERPPATKPALRGRTAGDLIVALDPAPGQNPVSMVGSIVPVTIRSASALLLHGAIR
ncbi:MAG: (dimethylallyl)adenosine tRNA methylthiotransferase MiaB [Planctomycetota bacterium]|jgi:tRNA-2-methylthio-N6-dimethylallyladenosine synthase